MSDTDSKKDWREVDDDELPDLDTEEGRDVWVEILMAQDDETLAENNSGWCKALIVADDSGNMVTRFVYPDGREELFDLVVRRSIEVAVAEGRN